MCWLIWFSKNLGAQLIQMKRAAGEVRECGSPGREIHDEPRLQVVDKDPSVRLLRCGNFPETEREGESDRDPNGVRESFLDNRGMLQF